MARGEAPAIVLLACLLGAAGWAFKESHYPEPRHPVRDPDYRKEFNAPGVVMPYNALEAQKKWKPTTVPGYVPPPRDTRQATPCVVPDGSVAVLGTEDLENKLRNTRAIACNGWNALTGHTTPGQKEAAAEQGAAGLGFSDPKMLGKVMHGISEQPPTGCDVKATPVLGVVYWDCPRGTRGSNGGPI